ncbi:hypothetical protein [Paenibacillus ferrarius]|uniref:hypothetical protein n=1 Tax=Paenibacillus ferrarius TaxID=1469647 RepID=UPI003D2CD294
MLLQSKPISGLLTPLAFLLLLTACGGSHSAAPSASASQVADKTAAPASNAVGSSTSLPAPPQPSAAPASPALTPERAKSPTLLVTHSKSDYVSFLEPASGTYDKLVVGRAPFAAALGPQHRAYVSTAEGIAVIDTAMRKRLALVPYLSSVGANPRYGEYRAGGMGLAVSPDGKQVYVGVYLGSSASQLEILDTDTLTMTARVPVGMRPFDVVVAPDGHEVYSIDHDGYTVTAVDPKTRKSRTFEAAPFGKGGFEKPHYAAVTASGQLLLPYQGHGLVVLDPASGQYTVKPLTGNTHQEGVALTDDGKQLLIVGIGAAGSATGQPNLTVLDTATYTERILPLTRLHQMVAVSPDAKTAYLTGGVTYADTGWDGMTVIDLAAGTAREIALPDYPLDVQVLPDLH